MTRRTIRQTPELLEPEEVYAMLDTSDERAAGLVAFIMVSGARVSECLLLTRSQIDLASNQDFVIIRNLTTLKHQAADSPQLRKEVLFPRRGRLSPFTNLFLAHLQQHQTEKVFPFCRKTAYNYVRKATTKFPHYFRSMSMNYWADIFQLLAPKYLNVTARTMEKYLKVRWQDQASKILS